MSRYRNAAEILPAELLADLQRYAAGEQIYVPRLEERRPWGERSGTRQLLHARNELIRDRYAEGARIEQLMPEFHLGYDSIRKIINAKCEKTGKNQSTHSRC